MSSRLASVRLLLRASGRIATVQGLAFVNRRPIAAVSALEALGQIAGREAQAGQVVAALDGRHRGDVSVALYRVGHGAPFAASRLIEIEGRRSGVRRRRYPAGATRVSR